MPPCACRRLDRRPLVRGLPRWQLGAKGMPAILVAPIVLVGFSALSARAPESYGVKCGRVVAWSPRCGVVSRPRHNATGTAPWLMFGQRLPPTQAQLDKFNPPDPKAQRNFFGLK